MFQVSRLVFSLLLYLPLLGNAISSMGGHVGSNIVDYYFNRLYTQTTLKKETLWIDGGLQSFTQWQDNNSLLYYIAMAPTFNATYPYLVQKPMQSSWDWKTNITETAINMSAPNPSTGTSPPQIYQGALYREEASNSKLWLHGGIYSWLS
ncbi:hypothetical protein BDV97DRAFT_366068 [Delphinella strobiligena]|nr:hypothetical protein BDV97DRAFT_366068 [Delphinella strobiligena]